MGSQQTKIFNPLVEGWERVDSVSGITTWANRTNG